MREILPVLFYKVSVTLIIKNCKTIKSQTIFNWATNEKGGTPGGVIPGVQGWVNMKQLRYFMLVMTKIM